MSDHWIQTFHGRKFDVLEPRSEDVDIKDIAHALSMQCRYNGHCSKFYSVAEHSVRVSYAIEDELRTRSLACGSPVPPRAFIPHAWHGLLHDAAEAYVGDMVRPLKHALPAFQEAEERVMAVIRYVFDLEDVEPEIVKRYDFVLCATEKRDVCTTSPHKWNFPPGIDPLAKPIRETWMPAEAERRFMEHFREMEIARSKVQP